MMGSCPSCGASGFFGVSTKQCTWCGKTVCNKCVPAEHGLLMFKTRAEDAAGRLASYASTGFCSDNCFRQFWSKVLEYPMDGVETDIPGFSGKLIWLWNQAIVNAAAGCNQNSARDLVPKVNYAVSIHSQNFVAFPWWDASKKPFWMFEKFHGKAKLTLAQNLERCGRTQDSAKVFEELRMYDKARELREKDRHIIVKKTDLSVNLNALLQQIKDGGIVAIFRCPHCGGKLKISDKTTLNSLRVCEHCDSEIEAMDLADFLKSALS